MYEISMALESTTEMTISFKNLKEARPFDRQLYIQRMIDQKVIQPYLLKLAKVNNTSTKLENIKDMKFSSLDKFGALWSESKVLFQFKNYNREPYTGVFRLSAPDYVKRLLAEDKPLINNPDTPANKETSTGPDINPYILWKPDGLSKLVFIPGFHEAPEDVKKTFEVIFGILKMIIIGLQVFLIFIRPCMVSTTSHILEI